MLSPQGASMIRPWTRFQDWGQLIAGIVLFISPWYSATWSCSASSWNAWIVGALIALVALWALATPGAAVPEIVNIILGIWLFISPWVLGFANLVGAAWSAWIIGVITVILAAWALAQMRSMGARLTT